MVFLLRRNNSGTAINNGMPVRTINGIPAVVIRCTGSSPSAPLGWVRIKIDGELHERDVYPTAINAYFGE